MKNGFLQLALVGVCLVFSNSGSAATPKSISLDDTKEIIGYLKIPSLKERVTKLSLMGPGSYRTLRDISFDPKNDVQTRWKALMAISIMGEQESLPELERAAKSNEWFMRDAALQAMANTSRTDAIKWSRLLLDDPSLVVRTSAVANLKEFADSESKSLLWEKLYSKINYKGTQSLWIRKHIVEALAKMAGKGDESRFIKILNEDESTLHLAALSGLERSTGMHLGASADDLKTKSSLWKAWWETSKK